MNKVKIRASGVALGLDIVAGAMSSGPRASAFARPRADHALLRVTRAADHMKGITPTASFGQAALRKRRQGWSRVPAETR